VRSAFDRALALAETFDLSAVGYIIAGAPFQQAQASLEDLLHLARRRVLAGVSIFYPAPASRDYERCRRLGLLPRSPLLMRSSALPISHTTSRLEAVTLLRLARILNFIKSLIDTGRPVPDGAPFREDRLAGDDNRIDAGIRLLAGFLHDGKVRGVGPDGKVFEHAVSLELTRRFVDRLKRIPIRGTRC
jgi:hypothetical protein